jgi:hypothetical protein
MGHSRNTTTEPYLHARPAGEPTDRFTQGAGRLWANRGRVSHEPVARTTDPHGREVVLDEGTYRHLAERRPVFLRYIDLILEAGSDHRVTGLGVYTPLRCQLI